jgi:hypothetical protein
VRGGERINKLEASRAFALHVEKRAFVSHGTIDVAARLRVQRPELVDAAGHGEPLTG